ncbi:hypothetical protein RIF29_20013 [Crotalaria pallida]|uniref:Uncharacterized protein n=1 Tax=Crotalaria pallida TaxID=3830 RepID=A0AAN9F0G7_CROPI
MAPQRGGATPRQQQQEATLATSTVAVNTTQAIKPERERRRRRLQIMVVVRFAKEIAATNGSGGNPTEAANGRRSEGQRLTTQVDNQALSSLAYLHTCSHISSIMDMKKVTCVVLIAATSLSAAFAASAEVPAPAPSPSSNASITIVGSLVGASLLSFIALFQ